MPNLERGFRRVTWVLSILLSLPLFLWGVSNVLDENPYMKSSGWSFLTFGAAIFFLTWLVFFVVRWVVIGFARAKTDEPRRTGRPTESPKTGERPVTAEPKDCPQCGLTSPPSAMRCDCGYNFEAEGSAATSKRSPRRDNKLPGMVKVTVGMAFLQGIVTALMVVFVIAQGTLPSGEHGFNLFSILDVVALTGLAIATLKRHVWATYGLVAYGLIDFAVKVSREGQPAWIVPLILYFIGAITLYRSKHIGPTFKDLRWPGALLWAAIWVAGNFFIGFVFGLLGFTHGGVPQGTGIALTQLSLWVLWGIVIFFLSASRSTYPFETVLLVAVLSLPLAVIDFLPPSPARVSILQVLSRGVWAVAFGVVAWGLTNLFRGNVPEAHVT